MVKRELSYYIIETIESLISNMNFADKRDVIIVIFVADEDSNFIQKVIYDVKRKFPKDVQNGLVQVAVPNPKFYAKDLNDLPRLYGDSQERVDWRSKQFLGYSYLYYYCKDMGEYFVQLEDDIIAVDGFIQKMKLFIKKNEKKKWSVLEFIARGFIGMTYKAENLESLSKFVRYFFWVQPVDLLFLVYNEIFLHKSAMEFCIKKTIFKHVGTISSLKGQARFLEDLHIKQFVGMRRCQKVDNPPAKITTTLKKFNGPNLPINPYVFNGGVLWATEPKSSDSIDIEFNNKQDIKRIIFSRRTNAHKNNYFNETNFYISKTKEHAYSECAQYVFIKTFQGIL